MIKTLPYRSTEIRMNNLRKAFRNKEIDTPKMELRVFNLESHRFQNIPIQVVSTEFIPPSEQDSQLPCPRPGSFRFLAKSIKIYFHCEVKHVEAVLDDYWKFVEFSHNWKLRPGDIFCLDWVLSG